MIFFLVKVFESTWNDLGINLPLIFWNHQHKQHSHNLMLNFPKSVIDENQKVSKILMRRKYKFANIKDDLRQGIREKEGGTNHPLPIDHLPFYLYHNIFLFLTGFWLYSYPQKLKLKILKSNFHDEKFSFGLKIFGRKIMITQLKCSENLHHICIKKVLIGLYIWCFF